MKATFENPSGSVEKLSPKESVKGDHTVLRYSVKAPEANPEAAKPRGCSSQGFAVEGLPEENPKGALTLPHCRHPRNSPEVTAFFPNCPMDLQQLLKLGLSASGLALSVSGLALSASRLADIVESCRH